MAIVAVHGGTVEVVEGGGVLVVVVLGAVGVVVVVVSLLAAARSRDALGRPLSQPLVIRARHVSATRPAAVVVRRCTATDPTGGPWWPRGVTGVVGLAFVLSAAGCGTSPASARRPHGGGPSTSSTTAPTTAPSTVPPTTAPATTAPAPAPVTTASPPPADVAGQRVVVSAPSAGSTTATLTAYQRTTTGWRVAYGPFTAYLGYNGFAAPGTKREGDGRTPSGSYGFGFAFGVDADPGVHLAYRLVTGPNIVWDDDPSSSHYNQWVDSSTTDPGADPEPMDNTPAYDYGAVIDYNTDPVVAGAGSAIFLHVSTGGPTAGCVSLPMGELLEVLRWLDPSQQPTIVMGIGAAVG